MRPKDKVMIRNLRDEKCHECSVIKVDGDDIKVHYVGWSLSNDEWLNVTSDRVVTHSGNETIWTRARGVVHALEAITTSQSLVNGNPERCSARGADAESAYGRAEWR